MFRRGMCASKHTARGACIGVRNAKRNKNKGNGESRSLLKRQRCPLSYGMPSAFGARECPEVNARTTRDTM